jgi:hypothetical protein
MVVHSEFYGSFQNENNKGRPVLISLLSLSFPANLKLL